MKIAVWKTGHEIADTVAEAVYDGLKSYAECQRYNTGTSTEKSIQEDVVIAYGILRGTGDVFSMARQLDKPFFCIDRGYWKPGHYDGYYRISLNGTQQTTGLDKLEPDYERWDRLGLEIFDRPHRLESEPDHYDLYCSPTEYVSKHFNEMHWLHENVDACRKYKIRQKGEPDHIDWREVRVLNTFNSSVGWEALRQGIPIVSDETHSIVGAWQKNIYTDAQMTHENRMRLFAVMAGLQLTLEEIRKGLLWHLLNTLLANREQQ